MKQKMDSETKERLVVHCNELKILAIVLDELFDKHRNDMILEIIPDEDEDFNTVEKYVNDFMPLFFPHLTLPKRVTFESPLNEKNFYTESLRFLSELEQAASLLQKIEKALYDYRSVEEIIRHLDKIKYSVEQVRKLMLTRSNELGITHEEYAPTVQSEVPDDHNEKCALYLSLIYNAKQQTETIHSSSTQL